MTRVSTTGRKAQNGQDDNSSVGCSRGSFLGLAEAEVRDTDFSSPFQLSVPFAEVKTADSPPVGGVRPRCREHKKAHVYHVYPTLGKPNSCYANVHRLDVFFLCLPSSSYRVWRFLCLFAIDVVVLRFSGVTCVLCSVWGGLSRFVLVLVCLLCAARMFVLWAFPLFGFAIDVIFRTIYVRTSTVLHASCRSFYIFGGTDRSSSERAQVPPKRRHDAKP